MGTLKDRLPEGYHDFLEDLKNRVRSSRVKAVLAANCELIRLYWDIGRSIVIRQSRQGWGKSVVERLSKDLQSEFKAVGGFSSRNIWKMRALYLAYAAPGSIHSQAVSEIASEFGRVPIGVEKQKA